jgi:F-type H+-transporting ATPase subunit delta
MKISAKQYATALLEATQGKSEKETKAIIVSLIKLLSTNQALKKLPEVIRYFETIWQDQSTTLDVNLTSARPLSKTVVADITKYLQELTAKQAINLKQQNDPDILGGVIIKYGDKILDASLKTNLYHLKTKLSQ